MNGSSIAIKGIWLGHDNPGNGLLLPPWIRNTGERVIVTFEEYMQMMRETRWGMKKYQRGSFGTLAAVMQGASQPTVTVSGEAGISGTDVSAPYDARAGVRFNSDGTVDSYSFDGATLTLTQIDTATDWVIPNSAAPDDYEVQCTDNNANLAGGSDTSGSYIVLTSNRTWYVQVTVAASSANLDVDVGVRKGNSGSAIDSGNYTGSATTI